MIEKRCSTWECEGKGHCRSSIYHAEDTSALRNLYPEVRTEIDRVDVTTCK